MYVLLITLPMLLSQGHVAQDQQRSLNRSTWSLLPYQPAFLGPSSEPKTSPFPHFSRGVYPASPSQAERYFRSLPQQVLPQHRADSERALPLCFIMSVSSSEKAFIRGRGLLCGHRVQE